ncbi:hypothetical protein T484DRAFT_1789449 [Baffinella frigidus]|nr:hypothetical protein T484DRAFT_1789449 [Cryptophyta sp. CCMP2293]
MGQERTLHFGAGTAGNKSLMSFRAGHGITGYAGYCPSSEALMIPTKLGPSERAGPDASKDRGQPQWVLSKATEIETVYQSTINRSPTAKAGAPHPLATTGPERDTLRETQPPSPLKFLAKSLYGTTYCSTTFCR